MAAVFAVLTGLAVLLFFNSVRESGQKGYIQIVVAARQIDARTKLTSDMFKTVKVPAQAVLPDAARNTSQAEGLVTGGVIENGEPILLSKLLRQGSDSGGITMMIPDGMRAVTVQVDSVTGVGGQLKEGDMVDVMAEFDLQKKQSVDKVPTSVMLLQNIEILSTGADASAGKTGAYSTVTLAVSPQDALKINLASVSGKLSLSLRSPLDKNTGKYTPQTTDGLN